VVAWNGRPNAPYSELADLTIPQAAAGADGTNPN